MTVFDTIRGDHDKPSKSRIRNFIRWMRRQLPTGLYARTLLIIILPMVILQAVVGYVFMERHWQLVTQRLSESVTRDIAALIEIIQTYPQQDGYSDIIRIARDQLDLNITVEPDDKLPPPGPKPFFSLLDQTLSQEIATQIQRPFWIDTVGNSQLVEIRILLEGKVLRVFAPRSAAYASNSGIFLMWMTGTSLVLIAIAILFLRNQIRPILALAKAAESFGKGQKMPEGFAPRGADEVRKASLAFILMRERIERQIEQRTAMLSGVSHDLRTILTRFKLQLALAGDNPEFDALNKDVEDMQMMLQGYLDFARGESEEDYGEVSLKDMFQRMEMEAELQGKTFHGEFEGEDELKVRPNAFNRLVSNITSNAWRHSEMLEVSARHSAKWLTLIFDDDGPGIPEDRREDVFKPFFRLDEARNLNESGTGLGLAIVRDIARGHGGSVALSESPLGGLRVTVRIPA